MGLVQKGGKVDVGLPLIGGEGVEDGALRLERLGGAVSLHGLRGKGDARGSGRTHKEKSRGEQARAPANARAVVVEMKKGAKIIATDALVPRAMAVERARSMDRRRLGGSARRGGGRKATRGALLFLRTRSLKSPIFDPRARIHQTGVHDLKALSC